MRRRILALLLGLFVVATSTAGGYVQYRYVKFLTLRNQALWYCDRGQFGEARETITEAFYYAPDSEARASVVADRRRFRFGYCEDYTSQ